MFIAMVTQWTSITERNDNRALSNHEGWVNKIWNVIQSGIMVALITGELHVLYSNDHGNLNTVVCDRSITFRPFIPSPPSIPEIPGRPSNPGKPESPGMPGYPFTPDKPRNPGVPNIPWSPFSPLTPWVPGRPESPGSPFRPATKYKVLSLLAEQNV